MIHSLESNLSFDYICPVGILSGKEDIVEKCRFSFGINLFQNGTHRVLVATSVAARGLDVKDISTVVNYDMPQEISEYIHRIGLNLK